MTRSSLPTRRSRWRSAAAGVAIAAASFTSAACGGGDQPEDSVEEVEQEVEEGEEEMEEED